MVTLAATILLAASCLSDDCTVCIVNLCAYRGLTPRRSAAGFFFYCKAELAIKPCRSSRSNTRGGFEKFHDTCKTGNKNTTKQTTTPQPNSPKHQQNKQENGKCHWVVRQVVKKSETSEAAQRSHMLNSTRKHKVSLVLCR